MAKWILLWIGFCLRSIFWLLFTIPPRQIHCVCKPTWQSTWIQIQIQILIMKVQTFSHGPWRTYWSQTMSTEDEQTRVATVLTAILFLVFFYLIIIGLFSRGILYFQSQSLFILFSTKATWVCCYCLFPPKTLLVLLLMYLL